MLHEWNKPEVHGNPQDPSSIVNQHCVNCGTFRYKRLNSKRFGLPYKIKKGTHLMGKVHVPRCDGDKNFAK